MNPIYLAGTQGTSPGILLGPARGELILQARATSACKLLDKKRPGPCALQRCYKLHDARPSWRNTTPV